MYAVMFDEDETICDYDCRSLAELCNILRPMGRKRYRVWSSAGVQVLDTKYGDSYGLVRDTNSGEKP